MSGCIKKYETRFNHFETFLIVGRKHNASQLQTTCTHSYEDHTTNILISLIVSVVCKYHDSNRSEDFKFCINVKKLMCNIRPSPIQTLEMCDLAQTKIVQLFRKLKEKIQNQYRLSLLFFSSEAFHDRKKFSSQVIFLIEKRCSLPTKCPHFYEETSLIFHRRLKSSTT